MQWHLLNEKLHYTSYHKKHIEWCKLGVYDLVYNLVIKLCKFNGKELKNLFIDSSMIKNIKGTDAIGKNHYDRFRSATKINVVVNRQGIPLSLIFVKASVHDSTLTIKAINKINVKIIGSRVIGDKGYINKQHKKLLKNKSIELIYPYRKNQLTNSKEEKTLLKKRYIVEHFFSWLKNYRKIRLRYDIKISTFKGFVMLACCDIVINKRKLSSLEL